MSQSVFSSSINSDFFVIAAIITIIVAIILIYIFSRKSDSKKTSTLGNISKFELPPYLSNLGLKLISKGYVNVSDEAGKFVSFYEKIIEVFGKKGLYRVPWYAISGISAQDIKAIIKSIGEGPLIDEGGESSAFRFLAFRNFTLICCQLENPFDTTSPTIDQAWQKLFTLLIRYRAEMPLNGFIMQLSMKDIYGKGQLSQSEISEKSTQVGQFFSRMQANLSIQLPVYVLCNHADEITGFHDICRKISESKEQNIIGWSNPEPFGSIMNADTVPNAFQSIYNNLRDLNNKLFCNNETNESVNSIMFPFIFQNLQDKIEPFLNSIFSDSRLQNPAILRGIYISGFSHFREVNNKKSILRLEVDSAPQNNHLFFIKDLFLKKIALEGFLVRPQDHGISRLNKAVIFAKFTCIIVILLSISSFWYGIYHTAKTKDIVGPSLAKLSSVLEDMNRVELNSTIYNKEFYQNYTEEVLTLIRNLQKTTFFTWYFPPSWFGKVNTDIKKQLQYAYKNAIIKTIYIDLQVKLKTILKVSIETEKTTLYDLISPQKSRHFKLLKQYLNDFSALLKYIHKFNNLAQSVDVKDLRDLTQFVFKADLPEEFASDFTEFYNIFKNIPYPKIDIFNYQDTAHENILKLFADYSSLLFDNRNPISLPAQLNMVYKTLATGSTKKDSLTNLMAWQTQLGDPENKSDNNATWLNSRKEFIKEDLTPLINAINDIALFEPYISQEIEKQIDAGFSSLKNTIKRIKKAYNPFFVRSPNKKDSSIITVLESTLQSFFKPNYMQDVEIVGIQVAKPGTQVFWDDLRIKNIASLIAQYQQMHLQSELNFPVEYQNSMNNIAKSFLRRMVLYHLNKSQYGVQLSQILTNDQQVKIDRTVAVSFKNSLSTLLDVLNILSQDKENIELFTKLRNQIVNSSLWMLAHSDNAFNTKKPYSDNTQSVINWDGAPGLSLLMFNASDSQALKKYLEKQQRFIIDIVNDFIDPIMVLKNNEFFQGEDIFSEPAFIKWQEIHSDIANKKLQKPNNGIDQLNTFIINKLNRLSANKMFEKWSKGSHISPSSNFFINRMMQLKAKAMAYSEISVRSRSIKNYKHLANVFNTKLAGKFPFSNTNSDDLDIDKLHAFFDLFDEMGGNSTNILEGVKELPSAKKLIRFINSIENIRYFMRPYLDNKYANKLSLQTNWQFRANRKNEQNAEDIVDLSCIINKEITLDQILGVTKGEWKTGQSIALNFRWPEVRPGFNPRQPLTDADQADMSTKGSQASFTYTGKWALLKLMKNHLIPGSIGQNSSYLLRFEIPTNDNKKTIVFNRVQLLTPAKNTKDPAEPLQIPSFPTKAPSIPQSILDDKRNPIITKKSITFDLDNKAPHPLEIQTDNSPIFVDVNDNYSSDVSDETKTDYNKNYEAKEKHQKETKLIPVKKLKLNKIKKVRATPKKNLKRTSQKTINKKPKNPVTTANISPGKTSPQDSINTNHTDRLFMPAEDS